MDLGRTTSVQHSVDLQTAIVIWPIVRKQLGSAPCVCQRRVQQGHLCAAHPRERRSASAATRWPLQRRVAQVVQPLGPRPTETA